MKKIAQVKERPYWDFWRVIFAGLIINGGLLVFLWRFFKFPIFILIGAGAVALVNAAPYFPGSLLLAIGIIGMLIYNVTKNSKS
tara:strand:+ start:1315 stop:1566 length:252 start_codon:yes stop_codon:yes gene_type:complete